MLGKNRTPSPIRLILLPLAVVYHAVTALRNWLFDARRLPSKEYPFPVIVVGNLIAGGSGKTPMVIWLIEYLKGKGTIPAMVSRGYGRKTRGFRLAHLGDTAKTIGDEPLQVLKHFEGTVPVMVAERRWEALETLLNKRVQGARVAVLDDAYQHRSVRSRFNVLLTEFDRPFFSDFVIPVGLLREARSGASRAEVIVVTKCPRDISTGQMASIEREIRKYNETALVCFATLRYNSPVNSLGQELPLGSKALGFSGLASNMPFKSHLASQFDLQQFVNYTDHHFYTRKDVESLLSKSNGYPLLCTEKDFVKLRSYPQLAESLYCVAIQVEFLKGGDAFEKLVDDYLLTKFEGITARKQSSNQ